MLAVSLFGWVACGLVVYVALASSVRKWQGADGHGVEEQQSWVPEIREAGKWAICAAGIFGGAWGAAVVGRAGGAQPPGSFQYGAPNAPNTAVTPSDTTTWIISGGSFVGSGDATHDSTNIQVLRVAGDTLTEVTIGAQTIDTLSDNTDWKADTTYIVRMRYKANPNKGGWSAYDSATVVNNTLYPNRPSGMTTIFQADGTVKSSGGDAFGIAAFGAPSTVAGTTVITDATNPVGSGSSLRIAYQNGGDGFVATSNALGGPFDEVYIVTRLYYESSNWDQTGTKLFYWGFPPDHTTIWYFDKQYNGGAGRLKIQVNQCYGAIAAAVYHADPEEPMGAGYDVLSEDAWHTIEMHMVSETIGDANDGELHVWVDNVLKTSRTDMNWSCYNTGLGFGGVEWYSPRATAMTTGDTAWVRLGEWLYAAK